MAANDVEPTDPTPTDLTKWDPGLTAKVMGVLRPLIKGYHRAEVRGLDDFPAGGALVVQAGSWPNGSSMAGAAKNHCSG